MGEAWDTGTEQLLAEFDTGVLKVTLNRPEARNALSGSSFADLSEEDQLELVRDVRDGLTDDQKVEFPDEKLEDKVKAETKATVRLILPDKVAKGPCVVSGRETDTEVLFAQSY